MSTDTDPVDYAQHALPRRGVTPQDLRELNTLIASIAGHWACEPVIDEGGEMRVCLTESGRHSLQRREYVVTRRGRVLHLMMARLPYGSELLGVYRSIHGVVDALGETVGWRRRS